MTAQEHSTDKMWLGYMEEADKYDTLVSDLWKDDANGVLVFVSPNAPITSVQKFDNSPRRVCCQPL